MPGKVWGETLIQFEIIRLRRWGLGVDQLVPADF